MATRPPVHRLAFVAVLPLVFCAGFEAFADGFPSVIWAGNSALTYARENGGRDEIVLRQETADVVLNTQWPEMKLRRPDRR